MKKATLAAQGGTGIVALALLTAMVQADTTQYGDINALEFDMANAAMVASEAIAGDIIEAELDVDDGQSIWEIDIVNDANQVITVEVDAQTGLVISTESDDDTAPEHVDALSLARAIEVVRAVENGALVEAELEHEHGELIWEVETLGNGNQETKFRINAETGEILI